MDWLEELVDAQPVVDNVLGVGVDARLENVVDRDAGLENVLGVDVDELADSHGIMSSALTLMLGLRTRYAHAQSKTRTVCA